MGLPYDAYVALRLMERCIKPFKIFFAPEDMLYYVVETCELMSFPCRYYIWPAAFAADLFIVAVYGNVKQIPSDEVADLCDMIRQCNDAAARLHALGGKPAA